MNIFNFSNPQNLTIHFIDLFLLISQQIIIYLTIILSILFFINLITIKLNISKTKFNLFYNFNKTFNLLILTIILSILLTKFFVYLWNIHECYFFTSINWYEIKLNYIPFKPTLDLNCSILSDVILLLAFSSGLVCIYLLGEKNLVNGFSNISIFSGFFIGIVCMVYTSNLLVMFLGFEFLFLPTLYFVYYHGYVERLDKTLRILLYWTLFGAFLVFSSISYIYIKYKTLNIYNLSLLDFSFNEKLFLSIIIFFGFGIKVPVFPFHYWLTKIHVEAPAGFSIFLSGFLVKAAIYCFYYFNLIFNFELLTILTISVSILGILESSIKMWTQTDFKKLIAFATIQEMNLILLMLVTYQNMLDYSLLIFILIHGWLSTLMFFLVDIIQKKTSSRNIVSIGGMAYNFGELKLIIWFIIIMFSGFPLTVKFLIEWQIFANILLQSKILITILFIFIICVGVVGFAKQLIIILYGFPKSSISKSYTLSKKDKNLFYFIINILVILNFINYFLG